MTHSLEITLPNQWAPRDYQRPLWNALAKGTRRAVAVWHRRAGKDDVMLHHTACAAHERVGGYWYMLPEFNQCRRAVWDAINPRLGKKRLDLAFPEELRDKTNQQEMMIRLKNGSTFQMVGSDNYDSLVGSTPVGVVFSEYALTNPQAWSYIRPILRENDGWAIFNGTPRGQNHLQAILKTANESPDWFGQVLTADHTGVFTKAQLDSELRELQDEHGEAVGMALFMQEYYCSFNSAILGSYYGREMDDAEQTGRICDVDYDDAVPVHTAWDLGYTDDTSIWFYQVIRGEIHLIDYHSSSGEDVDYYAGIVTAKPYVYGKHWLPHDARAKTLGAGGKTIVEQLARHLGIGKMRVVPNLSLQDGIQAVRMTLRRCWFDRVNTEQGVKCLREYQRKYDSQAKILSSRPLHDWTSHGADAFRMLAVAWRQESAPEAPPEQKKEFAVTHSPTITFSDLMEATLARKRGMRRRV